MNASRVLIIGRIRTTRWIWASTSTKCGLLRNVTQTTSRRHHMSSDEFKFLLITHSTALPMTPRSPLHSSFHCTIHGEPALQSSCLDSRTISPRNHTKSTRPLCHPPPNRPDSPPVACHVFFFLRRRDWGTRNAPEPLKAKRWCRTREATCHTIFCLFCGVCCPVGC